MTKSIGADLHTHTNASDGLLSPMSLVKQAASSGVNGLAITDHDTMDGVDEAVRTGLEADLLVIPGIELSTEFISPVLGEQTVHVLGYFCDPKNPGLSKHMAYQRDNRVNRAQEMVDRLNQLGIAVEFDRVKELAAGATVGRPHIARAVIEAGYESDWGKVFDKWIGNDAPAYVSHRKLEAVAGVEMIRDSGGLPVIAHPYYDFHGRSLDLESMLPAAKEAGLVGLEVYYGVFSASEHRQYANVAEKYDLLATGGSDFHGDGVQEGVYIGCSLCPDENFRKLCSYANVGD